MDEKRHVCNFSQERGSRVGFVCSGVTQACLNVKLPVLMMCVVAGLNVGGITCRRVEVMGSRRLERRVWMCHSLSE